MIKGQALSEVSGITSRLVPFSGSSGMPVVGYMDYIDRFYEPAEVVLVTLSLSARCGFRACSKDTRISRFVSLVGMFDIDRTLQAIYNRDFFGELKAGVTWNKVDILGFEIEGSKFYQDLVKTDMLNFSGTLADAEQVKVLVLHLRAENDLWVAHEDVDEVMSRCRFGQVMTIPAVGHEINEDLSALKFVIQEAVHSAWMGCLRRRLGQWCQLRGVAREKSLGAHATPSFHQIY